LTDAVGADRTDWRLHDWIIGLLAGGAFGAVVGTFLAARVFNIDGPTLLIATAAIGAIVAILMMLRSHAGSSSFFTSTVVVWWILGIGSGLFLWLLYDAIQNFE
jgi:ABC-type branched-subunit amino acid transport system permease subunit